MPGIVLASNVCPSNVLAACLQLTYCLQVEADSAAQLKLAQKVVKGLTKLPSALPFSTPVDEQEVLGYRAVVQEPMDLGIVLQKLKSGAYTTLGKCCPPELSPMPVLVH